MYVGEEKYPKSFSDLYILMLCKTDCLIGNKNMSNDKILTFYKIKVNFTKVNFTLLIEINIISYMK